MIAFKNLKKQEEKYEYQCGGKYPLSTSMFCNKQSGYFFLDYKKAKDTLQRRQKQVKYKFEEMQNALENVNNECSN